MLLLLGLLLAVGFTSPFPCLEEGRYRQFDFWLGSWNVYNADGELVGTNEITSAEEGCALIERWRGRQGSTGMSINYFEPSTGLWKQAWVAASGYIVELSGRLDDGVLGLALLLQRSLVSPAGVEPATNGLKVRCSTS